MITHTIVAPYQSAKIITSHVTYGSKLAKEIGLPKQIADFIPQHHGTRTLHCLRKAQAQAKPNGLNEADFRYPGPKPQFKEAIMMLADSCEAAARSLARPDPENIRAIVVKVFDAIISDGQLEECDVTLQELRIIREAMISALTAIYHARIDYPGFNPPLTGLCHHCPLEISTAKSVAASPYANLLKFRSAVEAKSKTRRYRAKWDRNKTETRRSGDAGTTSILSASPRLRVPVPASKLLPEL